MKLRVLTKIPYDLDAVFEAMRDQMPALAAYMPNVASIDVESREESDGQVRLVNRWTGAATEIPTVARPFVKPDDIYWLDHATWDNEARLCRWRLEMGFMSDRISCSGQTLYHSMGAQETEVRIEGELTLNLAGMLPSLMLKPGTAAIEKFVSKLAEPNFEKTAEALKTYLANEL